MVQNTTNERFVFCRNFTDIMKVWFRAWMADTLITMKWKRGKAPLLDPVRYQLITH